MSPARRVTLGVLATALRFVRFSAVGAAGMLVQLGTLWLLVDLAHVHHTLATTAAVTAAVVHNFTWHRHWTWKDRASHRTPLLKTFAAFAMANGMVSLVGNIVITTAIVAATSLHAVPANIIAIAVCAVLNFWLANTVVFRGVGAPPASVATASSVSPHRLGR